MAQHDLTFLEFLSGFRRGMLLSDADEKLGKVVAAIRETGGNGEVSIKLPFKLNKAGQLECPPEIKAKIPNRPIGTGFYFVSDDNRLTQRDPNQLDIEDALAGARERRGGEVN